MNRDNRFLFTFIFTLAVIQVRLAGASDTVQQISNLYPDPLTETCILSSPTPSPSCTPVVCYLERSLPVYVCSAEHITVYLDFAGSDFCDLISVEETMPPGSQVVSPQWDEKNGQTYIWYGPIDSYEMIVAGPDSSSISGKAVTWDACDGFETKPTVGDTYLNTFPHDFGWLMRKLPSTCTQGDTFTVRFIPEGGADIIRTIETVPDGWTILSPEDFSRDGNTYTWEREIIEYDIQVPVCTRAGTFQFSGNSVSVWFCPRGESVNPIFGDTSITVEQWSHDLCIGLMMPGTTFGPGSPVYLDLLLSNPGPKKQDALLFVMLSLGTGDFWFYPHWHHFPPDIDWETITIEEDMTSIREILPDFFWPSDAGRFDGAMFTAVIVHDGELISNTADYTFGWIP